MGPMAKKSKLDKCVHCKKRRAVAGVITSYYGVGYEGKQIKGSFPARGYCLKCFLKRAKKEGVRSRQRDEVGTKLEPSKRSKTHRESSGQRRREIYQ
jgi:hypothetical protein